MQNHQQKDKQQQEFFWADKVVDEIVKRGKKEYVCQGMWTPSGFFHIGNARSEIFTPYSVYRTLKDRGFKARQNFVIDDFDGLRKIPQGLGIEEKDYGLYLDKPCYFAPSPEEGYKSWADFFTSKAIEPFDDFGFDLKVISAYETYKEGKFNDLIKFSLNHSKEIVDVWSSIAGSDKESTFLPVQAVCSECKGILSTEVYGWDGKKISYKCKCGNNESIEPFNGKAKLHWRVHWVAHWIAHKVDFESGGKDHFSKGGSVDVGRALMKDVFKQEPPVQFPTEFILLYGEKISGSKGNIIDLNQWLEIAPPEVLRFMNFSYKPQSSIEFSLSDNNYLLLMDRYETAERVYYKLEEARTDKLDSKITRAYELAQISKPAKKLAFQLPYSYAVQLCQLIDYEKDFEKVISVLQQTGHIREKLSNTDREKLRKLLSKASVWVKKYAPDSMKVSFIDKPKTDAFNFSKEAKSAIAEISAGLAGCKTADDIQNLIFNSAKKNNASIPEVFKFIYLSIIGKEKGPKAGTLIIAIGKEKVAERLSSL